MKTKILAYFQICISVALSMPVVIIFIYALEPNQALSGSSCKLRKIRLPDFCKWLATCARKPKVPS